MYNMVLRDASASKNCKSLLIGSFSADEHAQAWQEVRRMGVSGVEGVDSPTCVPSCVPSGSSRDPPTVLNTVVRRPSHRQQHHLAHSSVSLFSDFQVYSQQRSEWWTLDRAFERHCNHDRVSLDQRNMTPSLFSPSPRWSKSFSQQCQTSYIWLGNRPT